MCSTEPSIDNLQFCAITEGKHPRCQGQHKHFPHSRQDLFSLVLLSTLLTIFSSPGFACTLFVSSLVLSPTPIPLAYPTKHMLKSLHWSSSISSTPFSHPNNHQLQLTFHPIFSLFLLPLCTLCPFLTSKNALCKFFMSDYSITFS